GAVTRVIAGAALAGVVAACASRTPYVRPAVETAPIFKEGINWKPAQPGDTTLRGRWWEIFGDAALNTLEEQIAVSNQTIRAAAAQFAQARAAVRGARSALFPEVSAEPSIVRARLSGSRAVSLFHAPYSDFLLPMDASYEPDLWGRIRGTVES